MGGKEVPPKRTLLKATFLNRQLAIVLDVIGFVNVVCIETPCYSNDYYNN